MTDRAADFSAYLRRGAVSPDMLTLRAAAEGSGSTNAGYTVPPGFNAQVAVAMKEFSVLFDEMEQLETESGQPMFYPTQDPTAVVATLQSTEGTVASATDPVLGLINGSTGMPLVPTFSFKQPVSFQLMDDAGIDLDAYVSARIGEALGRGVAAYAINGTGSGQPQGIMTGLTAKGAAGAITTTGNTVTPVGGFINLLAAQAVKVLGTTNVSELTANVLAPNTLTAMINAIDPAYHTDAQWFMSPAQWANTLLLSDSSSRPFATFTDGVGRNLMGFPVKIVNVIPALTASTVGGPVFGSMKRAFVHRCVTGTTVLRNNEQYADLAQVLFVGAQRHDIRLRDGRALVTVKPAAT